MTLAATTAASIWPALIDLEIDLASIPFTAPVSCSTPNAPVNCDNDIGLGAGFAVACMVSIGQWIVLTSVALAARWVWLLLAMAARRRPEHA